MRQPERPLGDIAVEASWFSVQGSAGLRRQTEATRSDERGLWAFCDLPGGVPVTVRQLDGPREVAQRNETVDPRRFRWLELGDTAAAAAPRSIAAPTAAAIAGVVLDSASAPIETVDVLTLGAKLRVQTDALGRFALANLRPGHEILQLRRIGYRSQVVDLMLVEGETLRVGLTLAREPAFTLPGIVATDSVRTLPAGERTLEPIHTRMNRGGAPPSALITREELQKTKSNRLVSVLMTHGIRIRVDPHGQKVLLCPRNAGRPALFIDGQMVDRGESFTHEIPSDSILPAAPTVDSPALLFDLESYPLDRVDAIEIYASPSQQPTGFNRTGALCMVLIWTRR
jgi:hypothetical protein